MLKVLNWRETGDGKQRLSHELCGVLYVCKNVRMFCLYVKNAVFLTAGFVNPSLGTRLTFS